jgi:hypothetical protein
MTTTTLSSTSIDLSGAIASLRTATMDLRHAYDKAIGLVRVGENDWCIPANVVLMPRFTAPYTPNLDHLLVCPLCSGVYRNCECPALRICEECGKFLDYGCECVDDRCFECLPTLGISLADDDIDEPAYDESCSLASVLLVAREKDARRLEEDEHSPECDCDECHIF